MSPRSVTAALALLGMGCVGLVRGTLYDVCRHAKDGADVYELPPPAELRLISLGYRSALADLLWSHVVVSQGLHVEQQIRYDNVVGLLQSINELEPTYREPYLFAETLITFQIGKTPQEDVRAARAILERGVRELPLDGELWLALGEFVAYVAPGTYLTDPAEQDAWRVDGAHMLGRAAELGDDAAAWQALGGASYLSRAGERDAALRFLRRAMAITEDPELKDSIRAHLDKLLGERREEAFQRFDTALLAARRKDVAQVSRTQFVVLGPPRDPAACAGPDRATAPDCLGTWREREEASESDPALTERSR